MDCMLDRTCPPGPQGLREGRYDRHLRMEGATTRLRKIDPRYPHIAPSSLSDSGEKLWKEGVGGSPKIRWKGTGSSKPYPSLLERRHIFA